MAWDGAWQLVAIGSTDELRDWFPDIRTIELGARQ